MSFFLKIEAPGYGNAEASRLVLRIVDAVIA